MNSFEIFYELNSYHVFQDEILATGMFNIYREDSKRVYFTRNGKKNGTSAVLSKDSKLLHLYSDATNCNAVDYNLYKFVREFRFGNDKDLANKFVYDFAKNSGLSYDKKPITNNIQKPKPLKLDIDKKLINKDVFNEEDCFNYWFNKFHDVNSAKKYVEIQKQSNPKVFTSKERIFRIGINKDIFNKNLNAKFKKYGYIKDGKFEESHSVATNNFSNCELTLNQIFNYIGAGNSFIPCVLKNGSGEHFKTINENWNGSELIALDFDNSKLVNGEKIKDVDNYLSIEKVLENPIVIKTGLFLYTTPNFSADWERFRIVFDLGRFINDKDTYKAIQEIYFKHFPNQYDTKATAFKTFFYGNTEATIYNLFTGEILNYKNGKLQN